MLFQLQPYDKFVLIISIFTIVFIIFSIIAIILFRNYLSNRISRFIVWITIFPLLVPIIVPILYAPQNIRLEKNRLLLSSLILSKDILSEEIMDIRLATEDDLVGLQRTFGVGGLLGYYGLYKSAKLNRIEMFATNFQRLVIIQTKDTYFAVSPENTDIFIQVLINR